jgi:hypothetical protein
MMLHSNFCGIFDLRIASAQRSSETRTRHRGG